MINNFSCINIASKDSKRLISFYKEILGIPVLHEDVSEYDGVGFRIMLQIARYNIFRNCLNLVCNVRRL